MNASQMSPRDSIKYTSGGGGEEEEEEFFNHYKNDLKRHAHPPSGVAGADLKKEEERV